MGFDIVEVAFAMNALLIVTLISQIHNINSMPYAYVLLSDDNHRHGTTLVYATIPFHLPGDAAAAEYSYTIAAVKFKRLILVTVLAYYMVLLCNFHPYGQDSIWGVDAIMVTLLIGELHGTFTESYVLKQLGQRGLPLTRVARKQRDYFFMTVAGLPRIYTLNLTVKFIALGFAIGLGLLTH